MQHIVNILIVLETCISRCLVLGQCMLLTLFACVGLCFKVRVNSKASTDLKF